MPNWHNSVTYLRDLYTSVEVGIVWLRIGHEGHSCRKRTVRVSSSAFHVFCREIAIHDECAYKLISKYKLAKWSSIMYIRNWLLITIPGLPVFRKVNSWLWAGRTENSHSSIFWSVTLRLIGNPTLHPGCEISPLASYSQELSVEILWYVWPYAHM